MLTYRYSGTDVVRRVVIVLTFVVALTLIPVGHAQVLIKVNDNVNFKLGILAQGQAAVVDDTVNGGYTQDLFLRRLRLLFAGQVAPKTTFFVETDSPNLGRTVGGRKNSQPAAYIQDAYIEYKVSDALSVAGGLILIPFSRNSLQSAASLLPVDYGAHSFTANGPTQSNVGRDTGFQARGFLNKGHFEYRAGIFQGNRDTASHNAFRGAGRVQYNFLDAEAPGMFYTGTYLGKKKVFAVGGGVDIQKDYRAFDVDSFVDYPLAGGAVTAQIDFMRFDGGDFLTTLPKQNDILAEFGYLIGATKFTPVIQYAQKNVADTRAGDEKRYSAGLNYWLAGHNANVKFAVGRVAPGVGDDRNEYTLQLQLFYF